MVMDARVTLASILFFLRCSLEMPNQVEHVLIWGPRIDNESSFNVLLPNHKTNENKTIHVFRTYSRCDVNKMFYLCFRGGVSVEFVQAVVLCQHQ